MENGFIFIFFDRLFRVFHYLNLVILFKFIAHLILYQMRQDKTKKPSVAKLRTTANSAIDVYQIFKFAVIAGFWFGGATGLIARYVTIYLIAANLFTYFYFQVWGSSHKQKTDRDTDNRRFLNTLLAIGFYLFSYAYLFEFQYFEIITWPAHSKNHFDAFYLSLANAFTLSIEGFAAITQKARMLFVSEVINTFLFFIIILTNAIPNHINKENQ